MNTLALATLCSVGLGVGAASTYLLLHEPTPVQAQSAAALDPDAVRGLEGALAALGERLETLDARVSMAEASRGPGRVDPTALDAAVARALAAAAGDEAGPALDLVEPAALAPVDDVVADLLAAGEEEYAAIWKRLVEEGRADEVLALLEARAEAAPSDPDAQLELGKAYIARITEVGSSPLAGQYAMQADSAFDRALEVDPQHWGARMYKAVSLSFWPPVFGKQPAAIQQFEILVAQQANVAPAPEHAQTHLLLGNMYNQLGQHERALAAWQAGAQLFPGNAELAQQLQLAAGGN